VLTFASCGACRRCTGGHPAYCEDFPALNHSGARADGSVTMRRAGEPVFASVLGQSSFATHALASRRSAVRVPRDLPFEHLAPLGCSVQTGAGAVLNVLRPEPGSSMVVFGAGPVGLSAVMAGVATGVEVAVVEPDDGRRALAQQFGAVVRDGRFDYAVETVGTEPVLQAAIKALHSPGVCATLGYHGGRNPMTLDQGRLLFGRTLTGVIEGDSDPQVFIPHLIDLHLPTGELVTTFEFDDIDAALAASRSGDVVKAVLTF
jgi:aryl-alcohol dehydrogenase